MPAKGSGSMLDLLLKPTYTSSKSNKLGNISLTNIKKAQQFHQLEDYYSSLFGEVPESPSTAVLASIHPNLGIESMPEIISEITGV